MSDKIRFFPRRFNRGASFFLLLFILPVLLHARVREEWVSRYTGPLFMSADGARDIAVDNDDNAYVTGVSQHIGADYATIKYDANGNELWVQRYNGPGWGEDAAAELIVDAMGNCYVTGSSTGDGTGLDYATIKYDAEGTEQWVHRYSYTNADDEAQAIAMDNDGYVYVSGFSYAAGSTYHDYATIKYDSDGNVLWTRRYSGPYSDLAYDLAVNQTGEVFVTGSIGGDCGTVKYSTTGTLIWVQQYDGPGEYLDQASAIAVDSESNVFITGYVTGIDSEYDYATIKYDTDGNELWAAGYNGPGNENDIARAIAVDDSGNVYVTGASRAEGFDGSDYCTIKYDSEGSEIWAARYNNPSPWSSDDAQDIVVDWMGNVYVTGTSWDDVTRYDYVTIKYDADGNQSWIIRYNHPSNSWDDAYALAIGGTGRIYVCGQSNAPWTSDDYATVMYLQTPRFHMIPVQW